MAFRSAPVSEIRTTEVVCSFLVTVEEGETESSDVSWCHCLCFAPWEGGVERISGFSLSRCWILNGPFQKFQDAEKNSCDYHTAAIQQVIFAPYLLYNLPTWQSYFFLLPSPPRQGYLCGFACPRTGFISACPAFQVLGLKASTPCLALGPILMFFCDVVHLCWVMFWCLSLSKWYLVIPQCVPKENYGNKTNLSLLVDLQIEFFSWSLFGILRAIYRWLIRLATVVWCRL